MANYNYIAIPSNRLDPNWLQERKLNDVFVHSTFISYAINRDEYCHSTNVESADSEFLCNTQEEFIQKVEQIKLLKLLNQ